MKLVKEGLFGLDDGTSFHDSHDKADSYDNGGSPKKNISTITFKKMLYAAEEAKNALDEMLINPRETDDEELLDAYFTADGAVEELMTILDKRIAGK